MRYIRLRVWFLIGGLVLILFLLLKFAADSSGIYEGENPITEQVITENYPKLYNGVFERDIEAIEPFLTHSNDTLRSQGWRAFASTPVDSLDPYLELAVQQNSEVAWFALSKHEVASDQLRELEKLWTQQPELKSGIARLLGQQGDEESLHFLLDAIDTEIAGEYHYALALSRLILHFELTETQQIHLLQNAFDTNNNKVRRAYLYGWYRGAETPLQPVARDTLKGRWQAQGMGIDRTLDQYVNKMLPEETTYLLTNFYNGEQDLENEVSLALELATSVEKLEMTSRNSLAARILLMHPNAHVKSRVLRSIENKIEKNDGLYQYISSTMLEESGLSKSVWLDGVKVIGRIDTSFTSEHQEGVEQSVEENPYLLPKAMDLWRTTKPAEEYLNRLSEFVNQQDTLATMYVLEDLNTFWENVEEPSEEIIRQIRDITFNALSYNDRGIVYMARPLLEREKLFQESDFQRINSVTDAFILPEDVEALQQLGILYKERFEEQGQPVIDSLATLNYAPLNRSFAEAGWDVEVPEEVTPEFRRPEWERLWKLGTNPKIRFQTVKGTFDLELYPLKAPATVSAIDSLSRAGAYEGIPFHRVVPNFVIQGGDIERQDGFGGPDFVLPTEASELEFERGAAGIASAGKDTEGSQYFMMHFWKPHLNGNYTLFGKVIEGMDVVERIEVGDQVRSISWY